MIRLIKRHSTFLECVADAKESLEDAAKATTWEDRKKRLHEVEASLEDAWMAAVREEPK